MARVPITKEIISYASDRLRNLFVERIASIEEKIHSLSPVDHWYNENVSKKQQSAIQTLLEPPAFLHTCPTATYIIETTDASICREQSLTPPLAMPETTRSRSWHSSRQIRIAPDTTPIFYATIAPLLDQRATLIKERNALIKNLIEDVLEKHATLGKVLEVWPSALEFMPPKAVHRHNEKTTRTKSAPVELAVITDDIKASLIAARMAGETR